MPNVIDTRLLEAGLLGIDASVTAGAVKEVVIVYMVPNSSFLQLLIDDVPLVVDSNGMAKALVLPGYHLLHCRAQTSPHQEYEIEIKEPDEAAWKPEPARKASSKGIINDLHGFTIKG